MDQDKATKRRYIKRIKEKDFEKDQFVKNWEQGSYTKFESKAERGGREKWTAMLS